MLVYIFTLISVTSKNVYIYLIILRCIKKKKKKHDILLSSSKHYKLLFSFLMVWAGYVGPTSETCVHVYV